MNHLLIIMIFYLVFINSQTQMHDILYCYTGKNVIFNQTLTRSSCYIYPNQTAPLNEDKVNAS